MRAYERFLNYIKVNTQSDDTSKTFPSTKCQFDLAKILEKEMKELGLEDVEVDENGYVYGRLPATKGYEHMTSLGFLAHMDTSPEASGENVKAILHSNYDGEDVELGTSGKKLTKELFPHLPQLKGRTLITTDGTTLLGADDKAGIAEIMAGCERVIQENISHGELFILFTPDEEVGHGMDKVNLDKFRPQFAYTLDGGPEGEIEYECFNAATAYVMIKGLSVHTGTAKDTMVNAGLVACEFNQKLTQIELPAKTEGYEGFYHLCEIQGEVTKAKLEYIIRDHDKTLFEEKKKRMYQLAEELNKVYGKDTIIIQMKDSYYNMAEKIKPHMHLIENAKLATEQAGVIPKIQPIRGGTDGARLSFMGIPCPNIGTGGYSFHGEYEHITVEGMDCAVEVMLNIIKLYTK